MTGPPVPGGISGSDPSLASALAGTHEWFEINSGWAPPDPETLVDWAREGACRAPDECWVPQRGVCPHGLVSWQVVLDHLAELDATASDARRSPRAAPHG